MKVNSTSVFLCYLLFLSKRLIFLFLLFLNVYVCVRAHTHTTTNPMEAVRGWQGP